MGGGTRVVSIYARALLEKGHQVVLVSIPHSRKSLKTKFKQYIKGLGWPKSVTPPSHLDNLNLDHRVLNEKRPIVDNDVPSADVVIATWWETAEWVYALAPEKGAKIYFIQGHEVFDFLPVERSKATYRLPLHKIVISKWLQDIMQGEYGDNDVDLVHNSVDKSQFFAAPRSKQLHPTVGFLFARSNTKGVDITLQAIAKLKRLIPDLRVVSFGAERPNNEPYWDECIEFTYSPAQDKIKDIYATCDVWMTASRNEGFNLTAMEAMACRTPIVATDTGWPSEAIQTYKNGMLVKIDDVDGMAQGATWVLGLGNSDWQTLSEAAFLTTESSSWQRSADLLEQALLRQVE